MKPSGVAEKEKEVQYVVRGDETEADLERMEKRGITPVRVNTMTNSLKKHNIIDMITKDQAILSTLKLFRDGTFWKEFEIVSNMEAFGINPQEQVDKWIGRRIQARRKKWSAESFCDYVMRKFPYPDLFCVTKNRFDKINREIGFVPEIETIVVRKDQTN